MNLLEQRPLAERVLEGHILGQRLGIGRDIRQERQQRLHLRSEIEHPIDRGIVERLDAEAIARRQKATTVPERKGEHAAEMAEAVEPPAIICSEDRFGIGGRPEIPVRPELVLQFAVVVDLAVERDDAAVGCLHRLAPGARKIDDREPAMRQPASGIRRAPEALAIRSAMRDQSVHDGKRLLQPPDRLGGE
jgi:hypothetical protein